MKLLLHTCCADCLLRYLEVLGLKPLDELLINNSPSLNPERDNFKNLGLSDITLYYSNSNIYPKSEYDHRLEALKEIAARYQLPLLIADYRPQDFFFCNPSNLNSNQELSQLNFPFQSQRCPNCWQLRLTQTKNQALKEESFTHFSTTLLVSQYQSRTVLTKIGHNLASSSPNLPFFAPDTTPTQFYKTGGFYKQNFCGCLYSLIEKTTQKYHS